MSCAPCPHPVKQEAGALGGEVREAGKGLRDTSTRQKKYQREIKLNLGVNTQTVVARSCEGQQADGVRVRPVCPDWKASVHPPLRLRYVKDTQTGMQILAGLRCRKCHAARQEHSPRVRAHSPRPPLHRQAWVRGAGLVGCVSRICCTSCSTENSSVPFPQLHLMP